FLAASLGPKSSTWTPAAAVWPDPSAMNASITRFRALLASSVFFPLSARPIQNRMSPSSPLASRAACRSPTSRAAGPSPPHSYFTSWPYRRERVESTTGSQSGSNADPRCWHEDQHHTQEGDWRHGAAPEGEIEDESEDHLGQADDGDLRRHAGGVRPGQKDLAHRPRQADASEQQERTPSRLLE